MEFMDLTNHTLQGMAGLDLSADGGAKLRCEVSRAYEEAGEEGAGALEVLVRLGAAADGVEEEAEVVLDARAEARVPRLLEVVARRGVLDERAVEDFGAALGPPEVL